MYLDQPLIEGFQAEVKAQMADAIEFAVNIARRDDDSLSEDELRQAAQDALVELTTPLVESMNEAYERAFKSDPEAVAYIFTRLATRAALMALCNRPDDDLSSRPVVRVHTRKGDKMGRLYGVTIKDGEEVIELSEATGVSMNSGSGMTTIPVVSIIEIEEVERTP